MERILNTLNNYGKDSKPNMIFIEKSEDVEEDNVGPKILEDEVRQALKELKTIKQKELTIFLQKC